MKPDNPFSSGPPGAPASKTGVSKLVPAAEDLESVEAAEEEVAEEEVVLPAAKVAKVRPATLAEGGELPPLEMEETSCRTCQFFHSEEDSRFAASEGECRYNAPNPVLMSARNGPSWTGTPGAGNGTRESATMIWSRWREW
ncbi:hypothetical protein N9B73_10625 [Verrucomicrobiales bacterium]|nr:hypothetical protein [Verrucomicrobiales bacterium]